MIERIVRGVATGAIAVALALAPAASSTAQTEVCAQARDLIAAKQAAAAVMLIDDYRAAAVTALAGGVPADDALLEQATACAAEYASALVEDRSVPDPPTAPEEFGKSWDEFVATGLAPYGSAALWVLGALLAGLLIARLLVLVQRRPWAARFTRMGLHIQSAIGLALLAGGATIAVSSAPVPDLFWIVVGTIIWAIGVAAVSLAIAARMRLSLTVLGADGSTNTVATATLSAYLADFAAVRIDQFDVPSNTAGDDLSAIIPDQFGGVVARALVTAARSIFGTVPWRVTVAQRSPTRITVAATRNGYSVVDTEIDLAEWPDLLTSGSGETKADVPDDVRSRYSLKLAAGAVLAALADGHGGFSLLLGATDPTSIGLYYVVRTEFEDQDEVAHRLLAQALEQDPGNLNAQLADESLRYRKSTDSAGLTQYAAMLARHLSSRYLSRRRLRTAIDRTVRMRVLAIHTDVVRNLLAVADPKKITPEIHAVAEAGVASANELARTLRWRRRRGAFYERMRLRLAITWKVFVARELAASTPRAVDRWFDRALVTGSPSIAYSMACYFAVLVGLNRPDRTEEARKLERLTTGIIEPAMASWAPKDPELKLASSTSWYRAVLPPKKNRLAAFVDAILDALDD